MSKAVLISIRPKWAEKIANGEKIIEVRKTRPKLATPFRAYLYVTEGTLSYKCPNGMIAHCNGGREVIGEFTCHHIDRIVRIGFDGDNRPSQYYVCLDAWRNVSVDWMLSVAQLTREELETYLAGGEGFGWHISDLLIYNEPRKLTEFRRLCPNDLYCETCSMYSENGGICNNGALPLRRPPQSWCYVEEM